MNVVRPKIKIEAIKEKAIICHITDENESVRLKYDCDNGRIEFAAQNCLSDIIQKYKFQFEKVIRSAVKGAINEGETIHSVFIEDFVFLNDADYGSFIRLDRRGVNLEITTSDAGIEGCHKIYADGSFTGTTKHSGYGGFIEAPTGEREVYSRSFNDGSSNMMELLAVSEGLGKLQSNEIIQVNTDSRFVIRGLIQWVHFWRHNDWRTANNCDVKYKEHWQKADRLCEDKLIEFNWIKGHSGDIKQDFCHQLARKSAK